MNRFILLTLVAAILILPGCGLMFSQRDTCKFASNPPGATVYLDGKSIGVTPCEAEVLRFWGAGDVVMELGGRKIEGGVPRSLSAWLAGDIAMDLCFTWGLFTLVDVATGCVRRVPYGGKVYMDFADE